MRPTLRRLQFGLGALAVASTLLLAAPTPASATDCYTIGLNGQGITVCPGS